MMGIFKDIFENVFDSVINKDETVVFFPTTASFDPGEQTWVVHINAWVFEPEKESVFRNSIINKFGMFFSGDEIKDPTFVSRARMFLVDNESGKELSVLFGDKKFKLHGTTSDNGQLRAQIKISSDLVEELRKQSEDPDWITFQAVLPKNDKRVFKGTVQLMAPEGISVISDIDDTIKITEVTNSNRKVLLRNTFVEEYRPVEGMAELYRSWAKQGAKFHYLSGSPRQLLMSLMDFFISSEFPLGSLELRDFSFGVDLIKFLTSPEDYKRHFIRKFISRFPNRRLILVGDSGEKDEEIYIDIYRDCAENVKHIFIRQIKGFEANKKTLEKRCGRDISTIYKDFEEVDKISAFNFNN